MEKNRSVKVKKAVYVLNNVCTYDCSPIACLNYSRYLLSTLIDIAARFNFPS